jgi:hypothetical protein
MLVMKAPATTRQPRKANDGGAPPKALTTRTRTYPPTRQPPKHFHLLIAYNENIAKSKKIRFELRRREPTLAEVELLPSCASAVIEWTNLALLSTPTCNFIPKYHC